MRSARIERLITACGSEGKSAQAWSRVVRNRATVSGSKYMTVPMFRGRKAVFMPSFDDGVVTVRDVECLAV
jgi:hypothetical protein